MTHKITIDVSIENMEILDLTNAVAIALANSIDMSTPNVTIHSIVVEAKESKRTGITLCVGVLGCQASLHNPHCPELSLPGIG